MKFLFSTLPTNDLGLLTRSLPIARELENRGHSIVFCNPAYAPSKMISGAGFSNELPLHPLYSLAFENIAPGRLPRYLFSDKVRKEFGGPWRFIGSVLSSLPLRYARGGSEIWDIDHAYAITGLMNYRYLKAQCEAFRRVIEKTRVDAVIDFWNPFTCIAARSVQIPLITVNQGDALPGSRGFIWWKEKPHSVPTILPSLNRVLKFYGLPEVGSCEALNRGDLSLVVGMPETDPLPYSSDYHYIGSLLWQSVSSLKPQWMSSLSPDRPVIWLYGGNPHYGGRNKAFDSAALYRACFEALSDSSYQVVMGTGHQKLSSRLGLPPDNFITVPFVPGLDMGNRADLMIHHGGYGSCQTGLVCGTPALILPTFSERESNARRMALIGAAKVLLPQFVRSGEKSFDPQAIRTAAQNILSSPSYRENARKYGKKLLGYGGLQRVANLVEDFLRHRNRSGRCQETAGT